LPFAEPPSDRSSKNASSTEPFGERVCVSIEDTSSFSEVGRKLPSNNSDDVTDSASTARGAWNHTIDIKEQRGLQQSKELSESKKLEATTAEAELDDLLDMLDSQVSRGLVQKDSDMNVPRRSPSAGTNFPASYLASSKPLSVSLQEPKIDHVPRKAKAESVQRVTPKPTGTPFQSTPKVENITQSSAKSTFVTPSQDEDFDSWLDEL
jgi:hypothetical protein